ncbi:oligosaccharide flippase family protein [Nocardioides dubius]|uniref:Membrane protein involved in the export of O-antigen and teichoic acid n=1 Tax=Nocardioides dubius TaxID=317019 RepID=A0ABN1TK31_9ACTN
MATLHVTHATRAHLGQIARGGAAGLAGALIAGGAGFGLVVVVARSLPAAQAGVFFAVTALFLIVEGLAVLGTDTGLARFVLRLEATRSSAAIVSLIRATMRTTLAGAAILAVILALVAQPLCQALGWGDDAARALTVLAIALPAAVLADLSLAATRAFGEMRSTVLVDRIVRAGSQPLLVGVALAFGTGLPGAIVAWSATHFVGAALALVALQHRLRQRGHGSIRRAGSLAPGVLGEFWSFTWLRGLARVAQLGMQKLDIIIVAALVSPTAAAAYTVATRFVPLGQMATQAIQQVLQPRMTAILVHDDPRTLSEVYRVSTAWNMIVAWPLYLGVGALAATYLEIFGGTALVVEDAELVVAVMALTMMAAVASGPVDTLLLMAGRSGVSAANTALALVIDVVGCLLLVPRLGILGAALAWAAAVLTRCSLAFWQVRRELGVHALSRVTARAGVIPLLCVGAPALALAALDPEPALLWSGVALIAVLYCLVLWRWRQALALDGLLAKIRRGGRAQEA